MRLVNAYVRYRGLIHMRMIAGLYAAHASNNGRIYPRAIFPYPSGGLAVGEIFTWDALSYDADYRNYAKVMQQ